jgi:hypothetical protein
VKREASSSDNAVCRRPSNKIATSRVPGMPGKVEALSALSTQSDAMNV